MARKAKFNNKVSTKMHTVLCWSNQMQLPAKQQIFGLGRHFEWQAQPDNWRPILGGYLHMKEMQQTKMWHLRSTSNVKVDLLSLPTPLLAMQSKLVPESCKVAFMTSRELFILAPSANVALSSVKISTSDLIRL